MSDLSNIVTKVQPGSDILRTYPNALIQIYTSGTDTLITEVTSDQNGIWAVPTLTTGHYDIKVDGKLTASIHHVTADHIHTAHESWQFFKSGSISADQDEVSSMPIFSTNVAGTISKIKILAQQVDASADLYVHILKGAAAQASVLTVAGDSAWNYRILPGAAIYRFQYIDSNPGVSLAANDSLTIGLNYTAGTIAGLTVLVIFRPS